MRPPHHPVNALTLPRAHPDVTVCDVYQGLSPLSRCASRTLDTRLRLRRVGQLRPQQAAVWLSRNLVINWGYGHLLFFFGGQVHDGGDH